ncbi:MAG: baseplate J/gp47 family protein [Pseudomonadota bacterium]
MADLPIVVTSAGLQPQAPSSLLAQLIALVSASNPGYTANLPGSLIEDISSTDVAAIALCDSARVDLVNSLTPYGANPFLLKQLGNIYGVTLNSATNTSAFVVFSGPAGFVIPVGFTVSDGTYQYVVQDGGIIGLGGTSIPLFVVANQTGSWPVVANTITQIVTSVSTPIVITVTNPSAGLPGLATGETEESYRARVLQAGRAASQGMATYLKTLLSDVPGVQPNLISIRQQSGGGWSVICGGGDPYQVAYAIYTALFDISTLVGSSINSGRNEVVSINDFPDTYLITYILPPQQTVTMVINWHSTSPNYVDPVTIATLVQAAQVEYVNAVVVGQPMNLLQMRDAFLAVLPPSIPAASISKLDFVISINGTVTPPATGTTIIQGDPESYLFAVSSGITVNEI